MRNGNYVPLMLERTAYYPDGLTQYSRSLCIAVVSELPEGRTPLGFVDKRVRRILYSIGSKRGQRDLDGIDAQGTAASAVASVVNSIRRESKPQR